MTDKNISKGLIFSLMIFIFYSCELPSRQNQGGTKATVLRTVSEDQSIPNEEYVMVTTAINYLKKNERYQTELLFEAESLHAVTNHHPEINMEAKALAELIRQLPPGYQTIFNLYAVEGYSHVEIASMLGISDGTSRSQYARARALLINWVEKFSLKAQDGNYGTK